MDERRLNRNEIVADLDRRARVYVATERAIERGHALTRALRRRRRIRNAMATSAWIVAVAAFFSALIGLATA